MNLLLLISVVEATGLTYTASNHVLKTFTTLGSPRLLAAIVAFLSGLSLWSQGPGNLALMRFSRAALGLSLVFLPMVKWLWRSETIRDMARRIRNLSFGNSRPDPGASCKAETPKSSMSRPLSRIQPEEEQ